MNARYPVLTFILALDVLILRAQSPSKPTPSPRSPRRPATCLIAETRIKKRSVILGEVWPAPGPNGVEGPASRDVNLYDKPLGHYKTRAPHPPPEVPHAGTRSLAHLHGGLKSIYLESSIRFLEGGRNRPTQAGAKPFF